MPELPEVEYAARVARRAAVGRTILAIRTLHASQRRALPDAMASAVTGDVVRDILRRGKHQLVVLASGRLLHVHFRLNGDWVVTDTAAPVPAHARVAIDFTDGSCLVLADSRALATIVLHPAGSDPLASLGPEATDQAFDATWLRAILARRRGPIKPVLLDQRVVAGIGNIYAVEALWYAHIHPRARADRIGAGRLTNLVRGVRRAMAKALAHPERYYGASGVSDAIRFNVYDRDGRPCRRCRTPIRRITQAGRSSYFCPRCQR